MLKTKDKNVLFAPIHLNSNCYIEANMFMAQIVNEMG